MVFINKSDLQFVSALFEQMRYDLYETNFEAFDIGAQLIFHRYIL